MSHGLEVSVDGFKAAFASRGEPGWHLLGTVLPQDADITTADMLDVAHLAGWDTRLVPVTVGDIPQDRFVTQPYAVVRDNPFDGEEDVLAVVGERYKIVQNEELFGFGDNILDGGGLWETAGSIKDGRVVFGSLSMPNDVVLDPNGSADEVRSYLLITTSHDGSTAVTAAVTPVRVVCQNTLAMALGNVKQSFKIRHTATVEGKIAAARDALGVTFDYMSVFQMEAEAMIQQSMTDAQFLDIVQQLYPKPTAADSKAAKTRWDNKVVLLESIFSGTADGPDTTANIRNTAWAGLNALTEALDWYRNPRKGNAESVLVGASGMDPVTTAEKQRIRNAVLASI